MAFLKHLFSSIFSCLSFECRYISVCSGGNKPICFNSQPFEYCMVYLDDRCSACSHLWDCQKFEAVRCKKRRNEVTFPNEH